jgi:hypothetical protein
LTLNVEKFSRDLGEEASQLQAATAFFKLERNPAGRRELVVRVDQPDRLALPRG